MRYLQGAHPLHPQTIRTTTTSECRATPLRLRSEVGLIGSGILFRQSQPLLVARIDDCGWEIGEAHDMSGDVIRKFERGAMDIEYYNEQTGKEDLDLLNYMGMYEYMCGEE